MTDILKVISQRVDPFEDDMRRPGPEVEQGLQRDGRGRPMLFPAKGPRVRVPYSRMSSLADYVGDQRGVHIWEQRYLARAMALSPDLCALAAVETYNTGFGAPEPKEKRESGRRLDDIIYRALDRVMIHEKADYGTAFHALTEPGNEGAPVDAPLAAMCASFEQVTRGLSFLGTEMFVANDELMCAGTFDHMVRVPGFEGACILDKKSGKLHPEQFAVQFAGYANGELYLPETDERVSLESQFGPINRKVAFVAWTPADAAKNGDPRTLLYPIDIEKGYIAAKVAAWVRDYQNSGDLMGRALNPVMLERRRAAELIEECSTKDELLEVYTAFADVWVPELTEAGGRRLEAAKEIAA